MGPKLARTQAAMASRSDSLEATRVWMVLTGPSAAPMTVAFSWDFTAGTRLRKSPTVALLARTWAHSSPMRLMRSVGLRAVSTLLTMAEYCAGVYVLR